MKLLGWNVVVLTLVFVALLFGQIEIDWTEVPQDIGIQFTHNGAESVSVDFGSQGGPQTWNFTSQPMGSQYTDALIVPRMSTPYGDSFPNSNLVLEITQNSDTGYAYGQIAPTFGSNLGFGSVGSITTFFRFEPTDSYPMPMIYGATRTYHYGYSIGLAPLTELRTDNYGFETIDAYGTVTIPYGVFDCLRMCSFDTTVLSLLVNGIPITVDTTTHIIYDFLAEDYGLIAHILSYSGETDTNFTDAQFLERLTSFNTGITEIENIAVYNFSCQPNPFTHHTEIRYSILDSRSSIQNKTLRIYDATGQLVKSFYPVSCIMNHASTISWDGTDQAGRRLPSGIYVVRLSYGGMSSTRKVLLVR